ncbi:MAG: DUF2808 domain-containing protein [Leptolyngbyaceae cyanobacterium bins.349]|nr:DUF2808 domain-containing protein [Leptolyngbyaceae cyanobacterium bins.349]
MFSRSSMRKVASSLAIASCLMGILPLTSQAQSGLPGFTLFGGPGREENLNYRLDFGGRSNGWDRYRLRIPANKMKLAVAQFAISYPDYFKGTFDERSVELRVQDKAVPIKEVKWNRDNNLIEIFPEEPVPANSKTEIWLENVKNPSSGGMFYFNLQVQSPGDLPLYRYIGTWVIQIS